MYNVDCKISSTGETQSRGVWVALGSNIEGACFDQKNTNFLRRLICVVYELLASESLCTNRSFKTTMEFEVYIDLLPKKLRFALASLRLSSHKLRIETDRYSRN